MYGCLQRQMPTLIPSTRGFDRGCVDRRDRMFALVVAVGLNRTIA